MLIQAPAPFDVPTNVQAGSHFPTSSPPLPGFFVMLYNGHPSGVKWPLIGLFIYPFLDKVKYE